MKLMQCFHECSQKIQNFLQMEKGNDSQDQMATTFGKLATGIFLYAAENGKADAIQASISKVRAWLGDEEGKRFLESSDSEISAIACACIDKMLLGKSSPETVELFSSLNTESRIFTELIYMKLTGQSLTESRNDRWNPELWKVKTMCKKYIELSPSRITSQEMADVLKKIALPFIKSVMEYAVKMF